MMSESHFWEATFLGQTVHLNTLIMVGAAMAVLLLGANWLTNSMKLIPSRKQMVAESIYALCRSITYGTAGERGDKFLHYVGALFLFILTANLMGQLPLKLFVLPHGELIAATGDFNVTAALAVCTLVMYFFFGLKQKGLSYFSHYLSPLPVMVQGQPLLGKIAFIAFFWPFIFHQCTFCNKVQSDMRTSSYKKVVRKSDVFKADFGEKNPCQFWGFEPTTVRCSLRVLWPYSGTP